MTQSTEFEAIKARHENPDDDIGTTHADRAILITLVEAERARADKAEAELDAEQVAHLKTRARLTEAKRELARVREVLDISIEDRGEALVQLISSAAPIGDKSEIEGENFGITRYFMGLMSRCLNLYGERAALARAVKGEG